MGKLVEAHPRTPHYCAASYKEDNDGSSKVLITEMYADETEPLEHIVFMQPTHLKVNISRRLGVPLSGKTSLKFNGILGVH